MYKPIFVSGPHGSGKTTLINNLLNQTNIFTFNDFDIDFLSKFKSLKVMNSFELSLLRLYHRIFTAQYVTAKQDQFMEKNVLVSRGIYDSAAYSYTYNELGWISKEEYNILKSVQDNIPFKPLTIILNPSLEKLTYRLHKRRNEGNRKDRDKLFNKEDDIEFLRIMHNYFSKFKGTEGVLYIEDNESEDIKMICEWVEKVNSMQLNA